MYFLTIPVFFHVPYTLSFFSCCTFLIDTSEIIHHASVMDFLFTFSWWESSEPSSPVLHEFHYPLSRIFSCSFLGRKAAPFGPFCLQDSYSES